MDRDQSGEDEPVPSPRHEGEGPYAELGIFEVDGERFRVRRRTEDHSHHYDWLSGPNDGYGLSVSGESEPVSRERHERVIRDFLTSIDPATGSL